MKTEAEIQLTELVSMPTITDDAEANEMALDYIEHYLAERGMHTKRFSFDGHGSLVATIRPDAKDPKVMLYAHVDVMAGDVQLFTLQEEGDKLIGRGTYDMKFAIAAYMQLVDELQDSLADYDFGIMITTDEEYGLRDGINGARKLVKSGYAPDICFIPDGGTDWNIEALAKGHWRFDLIATGRTAHSSRPWEGESASYKLIQALHEIKQKFSHRDRLGDTLNIGTIQGGVTYNQIPDAMRAGVEIRLAADDSLTNNQLIIKQICQKYGLTYEDRTHKQPHKTDLQHPLVAAFADSIEIITGIKPEGCVSYAASDAPYFAEGGIPSVVTRPVGGNLHGPGEWISRRSFLQLAPILHDYLETVAKTSLSSVDTDAVLV
jgi:succinyl-diaminopimelate desuccinylase